MKMHALSGGRLRLKKSLYFPDADRAETIDVPVSCFLLRHAQGNVLFDTGCHPSVVDDPEARWGGVARVMRPVFAPADNLVNQIACIGLEPDDIDVVINSHFHSDHCGCNEFFKKATVFCHAAELAAVKAADAERNGYVRADWENPLPIHTIEGEHDLFGDSKIVLKPLPGHTPGTTGALVELERSGAFLLASDTVSMRVSFDREIIPRNTWNADALTRSLAEVRRIEADGATVLCGHDEQQWATLKKLGDAYD